MKKNKTLILSLIAFTCLVIGNNSVMGAVILSCVVLVSCLLTSVVLSIIGKALTPEAKRIIACILGAFFALAIAIIAAGYAYSSYKILAAGPAALTSAAAMAAVYNEESQGIKSALLYAVTLVVVSIISGVIREVLGSASFAGNSIPVLANAKCSILTLSSGGIMVCAIVLACIRKLLPVSVKKAIISENIPFFMTSRFASNSIPSAFAGVPSLLLVVSIISMVLYAYI